MKGEYEVEEENNSKPIHSDPAGKGLSQEEINAIETIQKQKTGRTYTEGEVQAIRDEYIERERMICKKAQEDYDKLEAVKNGYKKELRELKQNPKP